MKREKVYVVGMARNAVEKLKLLDYEVIEGEELDDILESGKIIRNTEVYNTIKECDMIYYGKYTSLTEEREWEYAVAHAYNVRSITDDEIDEMIINRVFKEHDILCRIAKKVGRFYKINKDNDIRQENLIMEECSELIQQCVKDIRNKGSFENLFEEFGDVICTMMPLLFEKGVSIMDIYKHIERKYDRALERYEKNGEL